LFIFTEQQTIPDGQPAGYLFAMTSKSYPTVQLYQTPDEGWMNLCGTIVGKFVSNVQSCETHPKVEADNGQ
jgi:hypothetical protein